MELIISLGGSIIVPDKIDVGFLKSFKKIIEGYVTEKNARVVITAGGGKTCRVYQDASKKVASVTEKDLDWIGIKATHLNAELLRTIFAGQAYEQVIEDPTAKIKTKKKIIIGAGWKPGCSTDKDAVLLAKNLGIKTIINMTNIPYVYDKDPKKYKDAKPLKSLSWEKMITIVGTSWTPGMNLPFDPLASKMAKELGLKVVILEGTDINNFKKFLDDLPFEGTVIS